jgi:superfamily II DNA or RNA helicase
MSHPLRAYQTASEAEIFGRYKEGKRAVMFQLATGAGKTVLFVSIIRKFIKAGKRVVLIAHREELIAQAWETLRRYEIWAGIIKSGVPENFHLPCQVASIQTICRRQRLPKADLVIIDEAQHSQDDNSYGDVLLRHWPSSRILGVTATPYRLGGKGFTSIFDSLVLGPSVKDLIAAGYLCPFKYYVSYNPDLSKTKINRGDYQIDDLEKAMRLAPIVASYFDHCKGKSGICFAVNVTHSQAIVRQYTEAGVPAAHVDATTDLEVRRKIFKDLKDKKILVLVNVGIATEGTDIPNIDFVQLARPTKSLSMFLQMVGRATRPLWDAIKDAQGDDERAALVAASSKPNAIVLDNAGCYLEHGLPDQVYDWAGYFIGRDKRGKDVEETIEIIELVAERENGETVVSRIPDEVAGLKLREVNYIEREKIINLATLKVFDKNLEIFKRLPHIKKAGFVAFRNYFDFCKKNNYLMTDQVWQYLKKKLVTDPEDERLKSSQRYLRDTEIIKQNNPRYIAENLVAAAFTLHQKRLEQIDKVKVPSSFLMQERARYEKLNQVSA